MSAPGSKRIDPDALTTPLGAETQTSLVPADYATPLGERYDALEPLGAGGMGIVLKARDRVTSETVAVKVLKPEIAADEQILNRFVNELRCARRITHKNACRVHEMLRLGNVVAISMEFVEGETLRSVLRRFGSLSVPNAVRIARQICAVLVEAHQEGFVHRDLKPENIMLTRDGSAKVMDFGIARSLAADSTQTMSVIGTPAYMAPEQAEGKRPVDGRADLYSLGLILYEMLTGRAAFSGDTPVAVALQQVRDTPPAPMEVEPSIPPQLSVLVMRCLEKDPDKRIQSAQELDGLLASPIAAAVAATAPAALPPELDPAAYLGRFPAWLVRSEGKILGALALIGALIASGTLLQRTDFYICLFAVATLALSLMLWPVLSRLGRLFWVNVVVGTACWILAVSIGSMLESPLRMAFALRGEKLLKWSDIAITACGGLRVIYVATAALMLLSLLVSPRNDVAAMLHKPAKRAIAVVILVLQTALLFALLFGGVFTPLYLLLTSH